MATLSKNYYRNYEYHLGDSSNFYNQRNNRIDPYNTCTPTNIVQALEILGYSFPSEPYSEYSQPEDRLTLFTRNDPSVLDFYSKLYPREYKSWITTKKNNPPNEFHKVMEFATNSWMGRKVVEFVENFPIQDIIKEILVNNRPLVVSGLFNNLNHVVTIEGLEILEHSWQTKPQSELTFDDIENIIIWDTYGETYVYDGVKNGYNIHIPPYKLISDLKNLNSTSTKWCYKFYDKI